MHTSRRDFAKQLAGGALIAAAGPSLAMQQPVGRAPKFSVMLWTLTKGAPFDRCLEMVAEAGYSGVELVGEFQHWSPAERERVLARMQTLGLVVDAISGVQAGFAVPAESEAFRQQFAVQLQAAQALHCPQVILLSGPTVMGAAEGAQRATALANLSRAAQAAAKAQVEIVIEPIDPLENPAIWMGSVTQAADLVRAAGQPNLKVLCDLYHEQRGYGNLLEKLEANIDLIGLIHVADVPGRHEPGTGEINYPAIYRKLAQLHYGRWIAMEFYPTTDPVSTLRQARLQAQAAFA